jgi:hypothetical protein
MKTKFMYLIVLGVLLLNVNMSCNSDNNNDPLPLPGVIENQVVATVKAGTWKITNFEENAVNETAKFAGYNFTFAADNVLTATNGTNTYKGTWNIADSNSNDDNLTDLEFNIKFAAPKDFEELSDDWDIQERTDTKIKLIDVGKGTEATDYLTFEKNP